MSTKNPPPPEGPQILVTEDTALLLKSMLRALDSSCNVTALNLGTEEVPRAESVEATKEAVAARIRRAIEGGVKLLLLDFETKRGDTVVLTAAQFLALLQHGEADATEGVTIWIVTGSKPGHVQAALRAADVRADQIIMKPVSARDLRTKVHAAFTPPLAPLA